MAGAAIVIAMICKNRDQKQRKQSAGNLGKPLVETFNLGITSFKSLMKELQLKDEDYNRILERLTSQNVFLTYQACIQI